MPKHPVAVSILGRERDRAGTSADRPESVFRPTLALAVEHDIPYRDLVILYEKEDADQRALLKGMCDDIAEAWERCGIRGRRVVPMAHRFTRPFDLDATLGELSGVLNRIAADREASRVYLSVNTGTHVINLAMFLLANYGDPLDVPFGLVQVQPKGDRKLPLSPESVGAVSAYHGWAASDALQEQVRNRLDKRRTQEADRELRLLSDVLEIGSATDDPILLLGESGVGKTRLAKRIHGEWAEKRRKQRLRVADPMQEANCAGISKDLAESLLFGHEKGAFTGATADTKGLLLAADGGTLFLDEVGELDLAVQAKLLKAIDERRFAKLGSTKTETSNFRLIAATNRDLAEEVRAGRFRADLHARISCWTFTLPSLSERRSELRRLAEEQLRTWHDRERTRSDVRSEPEVTFAPEAFDAYAGFAQSDEARWPGNIRDLSYSVRRMMVRARLHADPPNCITERVVREEIDELRRRWADDGPRADVDRCIQGVVDAARRMGGRMPLVDRVERLLQEWALKEADGNKAEAGRRLYGTPDKPDTTHSARFRKRWKACAPDGDAADG